MSKKFLLLLIEKISLEIKILQIQLAIKLFKEKLTIPNLPSPKYVMIHHGGGDWDFKQVNREHGNRWGFKSSLGFTCGYHYFIEKKDGKVYQARRDNEEGAHCAVAGKPHYWNTKAIGICLQGNTEVSSFTSEQKSSLEELVARLMSEYNIDRDHVLGHKDVFPTLCPGKHLYQWLTNFKGRLK